MTLERGPVIRTAQVYNQWSGGTVALENELAVALADIPTEAKDIVVQNDHNSSGYVLVGNQFGQWIRLNAGESMSVPIADLAHVSVSAPAGTATVRWARAW